MGETPIQPKEGLPDSRLRVLAISIAIVLVIAGFACILTYALPLSKVRVSHLSLEIPKGYTYKRTGTSGGLIINSTDMIGLASVDIKSWSDAMNNETLYNQITTIAEWLGSWDIPPIPAQPVIAPHNTTIHGSMAIDGVFIIEMIGGVAFYRIVVLGSPEWHAIWSVTMSESISGRIYNLEYNNTRLAPTFDSIVNSLRVEGIMPQLLIVACVTLFVAAGIVIFLIVMTRRGKGEVT